MGKKPEQILQAHVIFPSWEIVYNRDVAITKSIILLVFP